MKINIRFRLSLLMFLEFFVWGAWYVTMSTYLANSLGASQIQIGAAYSALSIATIISPFFIGMIADRFFQAQKVLGILHLAGAVLLYVLIQTHNPDVFFWLMLLYSLMYAPTLALANSVAFHQMHEPGKQFPSIRVWGTLGWIATGWLIDKVFRISPQEFAFTFKMAAVASLVLGIFSFMLPKTPPPAKGEKVTFKKILGADALVLLKDKSYLVFFVASILICIPLSFYYSLTNQFLIEAGMKNATSNMTFGQFSEAIFILLIPFLIKRIGIKNMIVLGMVAWILRFTCFAYGNAGTMVWMLFVGILLHGVCFDFFFVTGQIYTDYKAGEKIKSAAQGLITMATYGVGMWIGTILSGYVSQYFTTVSGVHLWRQTWLVPAAIAAAVLIFFLLTFKEKIRSLSPETRT
jgi:nucleoside transporter